MSADPHGPLSMVACDRCGCVIYDLKLHNAYCHGSVVVDDSGQLRRENAELRLAIMNQTGDNLCWITENPTRIPPRAEFLESCSRYHAQISGERGELKGCQTIAQLEAECERRRAENVDLRTVIKSLRLRLSSL